MGRGGGENKVTHPGSANGLDSTPDTHTIIPCTVGREGNRTVDQDARVQRPMEGVRVRQQRAAWENVPPQPQPLSRVVGAMVVPGC